MSVAQKIGWAIAAALLALVLYAADGYRDALRDAPRLKTLANVIIEDGRGPDSLEPWQLEAYLQVEDPAFFDHSGVDLSSPSGGATTISQSLAKRLAFKDFRRGIGRIRQTAYAVALENELDKTEILALALDLAPMGTKDGQWITGVHTASQAFFASPVADLDRRDYLSLIAVMIAPGDLRVSAPDLALERRVARIDRLIRGECVPTSNSDIWLNGCSGS